MILYFSGTGNSEAIAKRLALLLDEDCFCMTDSIPPFITNESVGIVFPVYAWGMPQVVETFIAANKTLFASTKYIYALMTCGDDMGYTDDVLNKALEGKLAAAFSLQMPNTYVCLPGFDVDKDDVADEKVKKSLERLPDIAKRIQNEEHAIDVVRGALPGLKTYVLRPLFNKFLVTDKYFKTSSTCSSCQRCVKQCPLHNIDIDSQGKIMWKHDSCTGCLRCYHQCPNQSILFGVFTKGKGQKKPIGGIIQDRIIH